MDYRSDTVGSLLRPDYLKQARERHEAGALSEVEFKRIEDRAVNEAIDLQTRVGLDAVTDGELRRYAFFGHLPDSVEGFDRAGGWGFPFHDDQGNKTIQKRPVVVSKLKRQRHMCSEEFAYLRARTDRVAKTTLPSAQLSATYYEAEKSSSAYPTIDAYLADIVDILRGEVIELIKLGITRVPADSNR